MVTATRSPMLPTVSNPELLKAEEVIEAVANHHDEFAAAGELFGPDVLQAVVLAHENAAVPVAQENADEGALTSAQGEAQPSGVQSE